MNTIAAIATGKVRSAIGIIRVSGEDAIASTAKLFSPMPTEDRKLSYGTIVDSNGNTLDSCMCIVFHGPNSCTGEDYCELQCHGSPVVLGLILDELFKNGVRQALPGEFTKRAFLNGKMDLTSAEAVIDVIDAETRESALNAAAQLGGALKKRIDTIYFELEGICSHYHAVLDYPDEDIEDFEITKYEEIIEKCLKTLNQLKNTAERGKIINSGIPTAIVGRPNAGKSSLLNALLGYERAIVTNIPGTTRDTIEERISLGDITLKLIDTAGIHSSNDEIERLGIERSKNAIDNASLVINVVDGTNREDKPIDDNYLIVYNKSDADDFIGGKLNISAKTGAGIEQLIEEVKNRFASDMRPNGEILTNERQVQAISVACDYLTLALKALQDKKTPDVILTEVEGAMVALGELDGKNIREDITNQIFARFCVGK